MALFMENATKAGFHIHLYFTAETCDSAQRLRDELAETFVLAPDTLHWSDPPGGPHLVPNIQITVAASQVGGILDWLMLHRGPHPVLLHRLGEAVPDHTDRAMWLGEPQPLKITP